MKLFKLSSHSSFSSYSSFSVKIVMASSGRRVTLATFLSWGKDGVCGKETEVENGTIFVVKIWCMVCKKYKKELLRELKGLAKSSALAFIEGTTNVKASNVCILFTTNY